MQLKENFSLKPYNTFSIAANARFFSVFSSHSELEEILRETRNTRLPKMILGGGSNILFTRDFEGYVLKNNISGISILKEEGDYVLVRAGAGENWHQFVLFCIENGLGGVENLSLIPGNVGASPMQNIGAYGVEIKDVFHELEAFHMEDVETVVFNKEACDFDYRESVFKRKFKNQFAISSVTFRLTRKHRFNTNYGAIEQELQNMGVSNISIKAISDAVIRIRSSKLPDPAIIGNAGSFFKNPVIPLSVMASLRTTYPGIPFYPAGENAVKLAAGWLIEQCGWKGFRRGDAGSHAQQALVLVNYGNASGSEILQLSTEIMQSVEEKFGVKLEREVNVV